MIIKNLKLVNFRNYENETFEFSDGINIISGANAQGKTNSAEAIFYLCTGYSPKATRDKQLIRYGEEKASVSGTAYSAFGKITVDIDFFSDKNKSMRVNGAPIEKVGDLIGNVNSVFFNPSELKLVQNAPEDRRRFLDISLSQMSRNYFRSLLKYKKILVQRNALLKNPDRETVFDTLPVWDESLAVYGAKIIAERNEYVKKLAPYAAEAHSVITGGEEEMSVSGDYKYEGDEKEIFDALVSVFKERMEKDYELGYTSAGPHRDDLKIKVDGIDVRSYGSQGQQRTCSLSLKLAETEIFKDRFGEYPVLILDDAMSELDKTRRKNLMERAKKMQTIITCTEPDCVPDCEKYKNIVIKSGKIAESDL